MKRLHLKPNQQANYTRATLRIHKAITYAKTLWLSPYNTSSLGLFTGVKKQVV